MEEEDGSATPIPEEDRGLTMEDVFGGHVGGSRS